MAVQPYVGLPAIRFGTDSDGGAVEQPAEARYNGCVVYGRPGAGKTTVLNNVGLTDVNTLDDHGNPVCGVLYIDTHDGVRQVLPRIRPERREDVYLISLFADEVPQ